MENLDGTGTRLDIILMGLGDVCASFGMPLGQAGVDVHRAGLEPLRSGAASALASGAVDQLAGAPHMASQSPDLMILSLLRDEAHDNMQGQAHGLKPRAVFRMYPC
jgi:prephenate dehydrogenase